ncbi:hypothetical protein [Evansella halocellulosilytica]|uniref:hypothetical protein n=1 Tax=Evansella halocellulosilytica TaxID=2011013 RepID=UPI000BB95845|nr:hypothetical protein [Evansella halocellulosilytica]
MEEGIERIIDQTLANIDQQLYILSAVAGVLLFFIGLYLVIRKSKNNKQGMKILGQVCLGIGILAFFSGVIQILIQ